MKKLFASAILTTLLAFSGITAFAQAGRIGGLTGRLWTGGDVDATNTLDFEYSTALISGGVPSGWGDTCVRVVIGATNGASFQYIRLPADERGLIGTVPVVVTDPPDVDPSGNTIAVLKADGDLYSSERNWRLYVVNVDGDTRFQLRIDEDGSPDEIISQFPTAGGTITLGQLYVHEVTYDITNQRIKWLVNGTTAYDAAMVPTNPQNSAIRIIGSSESSDGRGAEFLIGPVTWKPVGAVALSHSLATSPDPASPANFLVNKPSWSVHANPADDGAITTASAYLGNVTGKLTALTKANNANVGHHDLTIKWSDIEATVGNYTWTRIDEIADNTTQPLVLNIAPIWDDGSKTVPASLAAVAWDDGSMVNAYKDMLTALEEHVDRRLWILGIGNEADVYLAANPSQLAAYGNFVSGVRTHARTIYGTNPFLVTVNFRQSKAATLMGTYGAIVNHTDVESFTYYATASSDITTVITQVFTDISAIKSAIGTSNPMYLQEIGLTSDSPSSESIQQAAFLQTVNVVTGIISAYTGSIVGATWYQLSDVSSAVRTSFGATSYGERAGIGLRDLTDVAKAGWVTAVAHLGGVTDTPPPPPDPELPQPAIPIAPTDTVTINNPVIITWNRDADVTSSILLVGPNNGSPTNINVGLAEQHVFNGTPGVTYRWSVQSCNIVGCRNQVEPERTFTIAPPPLPAPSNLTINTPANEATGVSLNPTLAWSATDATSYELRFGTTPSPTSIVYSGANAQFVVSAGVHNTLYYWTISAINSSGTISISGSFRTEVSTGAATHPVLMITAARQATWDAMRVDYVNSATTPKCTDAGYTDNQKMACELYKKMIDKVTAAWSGLANPDNGLEAALLSRVAGENAATRCATAYTRAELGGIAGTQAFNPLPPYFPNVNVLREHTADYNLVYDFCYDQWTQPQRDHYLTRLNELYTMVLVGRQADPNWKGWRCGDVDQEIGEYMGFMGYYFMTRDYNPTAVTLFDTHQIGGLTATTLKCLPFARLTVGRTARNMIKDYFEASAGGAWLEGSEYSSSVFLALIGCESLRPIAAADAVCDEVDEFVDDYAQFLTHNIARDSDYAVPAGDDEQPHDLWDTSTSTIYRHD
jgi:hypothetical protein